MKNIFRRLFGLKTKMVVVPPPVSNPEPFVVEEPVVADQPSEQVPIVEPPVETEVELATRLKRESDEQHDREREEKLRREAAQR